MIINGKEIRFRRTVLAQIEVAKLCPGGDPNKLSDVISGEYIKAQETAAGFIIALSSAFETAEKYNTPGYEPVSLTMEEILCLDDETFTALFMEAFGEWAGNVPEIKTEPKSKKKQGKKLSSTELGISSLD